MSDEHTKLETSPTLGALFEALAKAQATIDGAKKESTNPHLKSKYADLASVWAACRSALPANGLCVLQTTRECGSAGVTVVTTLGHRSGEWIRGTLYMPASKPDAQGFGSAITYARRYGLAAIVGISPEDDDGQAASGAPKGSHGPIKAPAPAPALEKQLAASVDERSEAQKVRASLMTAASLGELHERWLDFTDIKKGWDPRDVAMLTSAKNERKMQLARTAAAE